MNYYFGSPGLFGSRLRSKILDMAHIQAEEEICVKNQHQFMFLFRKQRVLFHIIEKFSRLPQEVCKNINHLYWKVNYSSMVIDPVISGFTTNE